ncbi:MAG: hypothetical protein SGPRY_002244 [Prymnesium sp.]
MEHAHLLLRGASDVSSDFSHLEDGSNITSAQPLVAGRYWAHLTIDGKPRSSREYNGRQPM